MDKLVEIIRARMVNRDDRYGHYHRLKKGPDAGMVRPCTAPPPGVIERAERAGKRPPYLGPKQILKHLQGNGMPIGCHAISRRDTCKWVALDFDRHREDIPPEALCAAWGAVAREVRDGWGMECVVENSGGGWHLWIPLCRPVPAGEAYRLGRYLHRVGCEAWKTLNPEPKIDLFPSSPTRFSSDGGMGGKWLRLPGRHHKRDPTSSVLLPDGRTLTGPDLWLEVDRCALLNTLDKWKAALAVVSEDTSAVGDVRLTADVPRETRKRSRVEKPATASSWGYDGWTAEQLTITPLKAGERREREKALVRILHRARARADEIGKALVRLYTEAAGESADLNRPGGRDKLIADIPNAIDRLTSRADYIWPGRVALDKARAIWVARVADLEKRGFRGWSVQRFTRWLDGLCEFLRSRALHGYAHLSRTIITTRGAGYSLRKNGGAYRPVYLDQDLLRVANRYRGRRLRDRPCVTAYLAYLYLLASTPVTEDGQSALKFLRPAQQGYEPWVLDCRAFPLDPPTCSAWVAMTLCA